MSREVKSYGPESVEAVDLPPSSARFRVCGVYVFNDLERFERLEQLEPVTTELHYRE